MLFDFAGSTDFNVLPAYQLCEGGSIGFLNKEKATTRDLVAPEGRAVLQAERPPLFISGRPAKNRSTAV
jgi:hypothetical protein